MIVTKETIRNEVIEETIKHAAFYLAWRSLGFLMPAPTRLVFQALSYGIRAYVASEASETAKGLAALFITKTKNLEDFEIQLNKTKK